MKGDSCLDKILQYTVVEFCSKNNGFMERGGEGLKMELARVTRFTNLEETGSEARILAILTGNCLAKQSESANLAD